MQRWRQWWMRLALSALLGAAAVAPASPAAANDDSIVRTANGLVSGTVGAGVRAFLGIPFAAPPVGDLRWRPPQPAASWSGIRQATSFGNACAQAPGVFAANARQGSTSEDCLYLNVYTPNPVRHDLPVMVWIHGGGFTAGSASQYDPSVLTAKGQAVIVTINYRLGPFGFLALQGLSAEERDRSSGDYGLQDQQAALRWVRRNIAHFGGSSRNVTIFGESAGGLSVCANLASPTADDLFERAITESGPCAGTLPTLASAQAAGTALAGGLGCTEPASQVSCMRAEPVSTLLGAVGAFRPNVDGSVLAQQIPDAISSGQFNRVPVMEGSNHDEYRLFVALQFDLAGFPPGHPILADQYATLVQATFGGQAPRVLAEYPLSSFASPSIAWSTVLTDSVFVCPARTADALLSAQVPTFAYEFNDPNAPEFIVTDPFMPLGAFHASELPYVFQPANPAGFFATPAQAALSDQMIRYWTRFADEGDPNSFATPPWPHYQSASDQFQSLAPSGTTTITTFAADHRCAFWASLAG
jgi:para-nitrobenzyl esterase